MPIITLLTDFGSQDFFAGAMKGAILSSNAHGQIVDLTHEIPPQDLHAAAFNLLAVYQTFPPGTIHVAVVDPGVGSSRRPILLECGGQVFVGPDNGIFSWVCQREGNWRAFHLTNQEFFRHPVSATFHGRDVFAPVAAALSTGVAITEFGPAISDLVQLETLAPQPRGDGVTEARIIHIDRFGNCITSLTQADLGENLTGAKVIVSDREIGSFFHFFAESPAGGQDLFCIIGCAGFLEIAARNTSAAEILNACRGQSVTLITHQKK